MNEIRGNLARETTTAKEKKGKQHVNVYKNDGESVAKRYTNDGG